MSESREYPSRPICGVGIVVFDQHKVLTFYKVFNISKFSTISVFDICKRGDYFQGFGPFQHFYTISRLGVFVFFDLIFFTILRHGVDHFLEYVFLTILKVLTILRGGLN